LDEFNTNFLNLNYTHFDILEKMKKSLEDYVNITNIEKERIYSERQIFQDKNKLMYDKFNNKIFKKINNVNEKSIFLDGNYQNLTSISIKKSLKFNSEFESLISLVRNKPNISKDRNLDNLKFCFSLIEDSDKISAFNIQSKRMFIFKSIFPKNYEISKHLFGSKLIQIPNTNSAFITGGYQKPNYTLDFNDDNQSDFRKYISSKKSYYFNFDNINNNENYLLFIKILKKIIELEEKKFETEKNLTFFNQYKDVILNKDSRYTNINPTLLIDKFFANKSNNNLIYNSKKENKNSKLNEENEMKKTLNISELKYKSNSKERIKIRNEKIENNLFNNISNENRNHLDSSCCSNSGVYCQGKDENIIKDDFNMYINNIVNIELREMPQMNFSRWGHSSIIIDKKFLLCVSGYENKKCEFLDFSNILSTKGWKNISDLNIGRVDATLFYFNETYLFCFGGISLNMNISNSQKDKFYINTHCNIDKPFSINKNAKKNLLFYNVKKIERLKLNIMNLEKNIFFDSNKWEFLNIFENFEEKKNFNCLISQMGILKINSNNLLLIGGEQNFEFFKKNNQEKEINKHKINNLLLENIVYNLENSIRLLSIDNFGNVEFKLLDDKLKRNAKFNCNNNFLSFEFDDNNTMFYSLDKHSQICIIDLL